MARCMVQTRSELQGRRHIQPISIRQAHNPNALWYGARPLNPRGTPTGRPSHKFELDEAKCRHDDGEQ